MIMIARFGHLQNASATLKRFGFQNLGWVWRPIDTRDDDDDDDGRWSIEKALGMFDQNFKWQPSDQFFFFSLTAHVNAKRKEGKKGKEESKSAQSIATKRCVAWWRISYQWVAIEQFDMNFDASWYAWLEPLPNRSISVNESIGSCESFPDLGRCRWPWSWTAAWRIVANCVRSIVHRYRWPAPRSNRQCAGWSVWFALVRLPCATSSVDSRNVRWSPPKCRAGKCKWMLQRSAPKFKTGHSRYS